MRTTRFFLSGFLFALLAYSTVSKAEDIDLYSGLSGAAGVPNVLMVMDTGANFSASANPPCTAYASGGAPSLGNTGGGVEQCALVDAIESLPEGTVNIGIMVNNGNNFTDGAAAGVGPCINSDGGCLVKPLTLMDAAGKSALITFIKSWQLSGANSDSNFTIKSGGDRTGSNMQEAWAYYRGKTGLSGKTYDTDIVVSGCQKNFIINIGNSFANSGGPADTAQSDPNNASVGLQSAQVAATDAQKAKLTDTIKFPASTCGVTQLAAGNAASDWSNNWADEWARYMHQADASPAPDGLSDIQNITTYTIGVINNGTNTCKPDYPALLTNMAKYGGGKYFQTGDASEVKIALLKILNEVQAVNSVFASSSLPVSVNTQGTFLNQVFIGMFRPDANGNPRWLGNLKQYQFLLDPATGLVSLGDSLGQTAISSAGTGFISPNAVSFWTSKDLSVAPDSTGGFWVNQPQSAGGAFDLPDGELVEKGGAAQKLRLANLENNYATAAGTPNPNGNPRKLYTYCPSGTSCELALTDVANAFSISNVGIAAAALGSSVTVGVSSIVRSGTTALVTTSGNHGFSTGDTISISGAIQTEYNVTQTITVNSTNTFTITGLPDYPTTPSAGAYSAALHSTVAQTVLTITRPGTGGAANTETATATTTVAHGFNNGDSVTITGATPSNYNGTYTISTAGPASSTFTYSVPIYPTTPAVNTYKALIFQRSANITSIARAGPSTATVTASAHGFHTGQTITIAGAAATPNGTSYNGSRVVSSVTNSNTFVINTGCSGNAANCASAGGTASTSNTPVVLASVSRATTAVAATATATGATASAFSNGDVVSISVNTGSASNETAYEVSNVTITCSGTCTSFTYPITVTPALAAAGSPIEAAVAGVSVTIAAGQITRSGTTATVTGVANTFVTGSSIDIATSGSIFSNESAYTGTWAITCPVTCSTAFTFGPVTLTPTTPAVTSTAMTAYRGGGTPPDKTSLVNWVRGEDNFGDEAASPGLPITVRPSIHGDVLHSRPVVLNYGSSTGVVAYYGANDGVYRAVNANQTTAIGTVPAGGELWGFIPTEFFNRLTRQRTNNPVLKLPTTPDGIIPAPETKDYFADGSTGVYQEIDADGITTTAIIYITMRRGGSVIYALNVLNPTSPEFLWKKNSADDGFSELGQTWSRPKSAKLAGYVDSITGEPKPVLIFGAGYDTAEDTEPPGTNTQGRGIFIVDAVTGALVWSATHQSSGATFCSGTTTQATCLVAGMDYSIPSDITLVDHDGNGKIDRLYVADTGGNVWRVDLQPPAGNTPDHWQITKLAALGCNTGVCASGSTPRKFFYPPDVVPTGGYDAVLVGSGDREHPLLINAASTVTNRFYVLSDPNPGYDGSSLTTPITEATLFDATTNAFDGTADGTTESTPEVPVDGFYITLASGEKVVNAAATIAGLSYFGTNQPSTPSLNSCDTNLGIARGYQISPFTGSGQFSIFEGGGLPPSPVYGLVQIISRDAEGNIILDNEGNPAIVTVPFCIGCGGTGSTESADRGGKTGDCEAAGDCVGIPPECGAVSSLEACKAIILTSTDRHRIYWYIEKDE